jgi:methylenetetrahydrofolate--tRNA-(uracil-5-)-methyltransferase
LSTNITIIGGGLAGCEAALQLAHRGHSVTVYEMRPHRSTPAHQTDQLAELVCSNSFKGLGLSSAHGLLKQELTALGSYLLQAAHACRVPAGESLTVDRAKFSTQVMTQLQAHPNITLVREEVTKLPTDTWTIVAPGPLCSDALATDIFTQIGQKKLHFFDAIAPVVDVDSIDMTLAYRKNRWEKGDTDDFINCPLNQEEYFAFVQALQNAESLEPKPFEKKELFEGCLPVEELARRGTETLRFGPMRPIGLRHPVTEQTPYAVIQLRTENQQQTLYNLVGFQTRLRYGTQKQVFSMVPALRNAEFVRLGSMHRNTFINSPAVLNPYLQLPNTKLFFAGQITGAEGYTEAVGTGLYTALQVHHCITKQQPLPFANGTALQALTAHLTQAPHNSHSSHSSHSNHSDTFQPMNFNFGLLPRPETLGKKQKKEFLATQAQNALQEWIQQHKDVL